MGLFLPAPMQSEDQLQDLYLLTFFHFSFLHLSTGLDSSSLMHSMHFLSVQLHSLG